MKRIGWLWGAAAVLALVAVLAVAHSGRRFGHRGFRGDPEASLERDVMRLELDAAKTEQVRAIFSSAREQQRELRAQLDAAFGALGTLLDQSDPDEAAVLAQAERIGELRTQADKARLRTLLAVRAQLSPEERAKLRGQMQNGFRRRGGRRRGPAPLDD